jgi:ABC-type nickel/cobalt efflux system permease component RcnA
VLYAVTTVSFVEVCSSCSLYSMRPYVIIVGCVSVCVCACVPGVPVMVKSGHRVSMTRFHPNRNSRRAHEHTHARARTHAHMRAHTHTHTHAHTHAHAHARTQPTIMTFGRILYKNMTNVHLRNST